MEHVIVEEEIQTYLRGLLPPPHPVQRAMEGYAAERDFPIVGPLVGQLLAVLARAIGAKRVFELGSGFGYSAFWFAQAVGEDGQVVHTDYDANHSAKAREFLGEAGLGPRVRFEVGNALEILARQDGPFDIIFCDIDKRDYPRVPGVALPRLRQGGLLIFDNALWSGEVVDPEPEDAAARGVQQLNRALQERRDVMTTVVPLRDGVSVSVKL